MRISSLIALFLHFDFESTESIENTPLCAFNRIGEVKAIEKVGFCKPNVH